MEQEKENNPPSSSAQGTCHMRIEDGKAEHGKKVELGDHPYCGTVFSNHC